ncbi:MAG: acetyltransferase [Clostridiales Family XIII bacterium]|nr:acetyltransferase [Clostridiales Family XIII bacterium]
MKELYIIGAGGFGREVADTVHAINARTPKYNLTGFIDDDESVWGSVINEIPVRGGREYLKEVCAEIDGTLGIFAVIAMASAKFKKIIARDLDEFVVWENIIHPTAVVSRFAAMGCGNIIQQHTFISANVKVGNHCMLNNGSSMGHDAVLCDFASVMNFCDITGGVRVGEGAYLGTSVAVIPDVTIDENAFICAGSVVFKDVLPNAVMIGNPAKRKR